MYPWGRSSLGCFARERCCVANCTRGASEHEWQRRLSSRRVAVGVAASRRYGVVVQTTFGLPRAVARRVGGGRRDSLAVADRAALTVAHPRRFCPDGGDRIVVGSVCPSDVDEPAHYRRSP